MGSFLQNQVNANFAHRMSSLLGKNSISYNRCQKLDLNIPNLPLNAFGYCLSPLLCIMYVYKNEISN